MEIKKINKFFDVNTESVVVRKANGQFYDCYGHKVVLSENNTRENINRWIKNMRDGIDCNFNGYPVRCFNSVQKKQRKPAQKKTNKIHKMTWTATKRGDMYIVTFKNINNSWRWRGWKIAANVSKDELGALLKKLYCPKEIPDAKGGRKDFPDWNKFDKAIDKYNKSANPTEAEEKNTSEFNDCDWKLEIKLKAKKRMYDDGTFYGKAASCWTVQFHDVNGTTYWHTDILLSPVDDNTLEEEYENNGLENYESFKDYRDVVLSSYCDDIFYVIEHTTHPTFKKSSENEWKEFLKNIKKELNIL